MQCVTSTYRGGIGSFLIEGRCITKLFHRGLKDLQDRLGWQGSCATGAHSNLDFFLQIRRRERKIVVAATAVAVAHDDKSMRWNNKSTLMRKYDLFSSVMNDDC